VFDSNQKMPDVKLKLSPESEHVSFLIFIVLSLSYWKAFNMNLI